MLGKYNIGINDAANGIPIGHPKPHNQMHTKEFIDNLETRLNKVETTMIAQNRGHKAIRKALRNELRQVGRETLKKCK